MHKRASFLIAFSAIAFALFPALPTMHFTYGKPPKVLKSGRRIIFNDDAQVLIETPSTGSSKFVNAWLDRESDAIPFNTFVFQAALPDVCNYETKVGEVNGDRFGKEYNERHARGIRGLRAEGTDVLRIVTKNMHAKGIEVLAAVRMNDTHFFSLDPENPLVSQFILDHPQYIIQQPDGRKNETALDYSHPEVRAHRLAIMREIVEEYDVDGLELNFVRWPKFFPRDQGHEKAPILVKYLNEIREMLDKAAKKRGRDRLTLGVRVPESIHTCWLTGIDIESWINSGCLDYLVVCTYNNTDPQVPVEQFTKLTKPVGLETLVSMGKLMSPGHNGPPIIKNRVHMIPGRRNGYNAMTLTPEEARAAAANYYASGADGISLWNVCTNYGKRATPTERQWIREWTSAVINPKQISKGPRTYHYLPLGKGSSKYATSHYSFPWFNEGHSVLGEPNSPVLKFSNGSQRMIMSFRMADGSQVEPLQGLVRFWIYHITDQDELTIDINGHPIPVNHVKQFKANQYRGGLPGQRIEIDLAHCPPFVGDNQLGIRLKQNGKRDEIPYMEELIVQVNSPFDTKNINSTQQQVARKQNGIKICIAVDSEGATGVAEYWARNLDAESPEFQRYRELMTADVNAAVAGCFTGGATEVYIKDDGFGDKGLISKLLDRRAKLLPDGDRFLNGLDSTFDGLMLIGFHAKEGAKDGVLAHTWSSARRRRYWFNNQESGELAVYAIAAGHDHQVPVIMVSGCAGLAREARELLGEQVVTAVVKEVKADQTVHLFPQSKTLAEIEASAKKAVKNVKQFKPYQIQFPINVRLELENKDVTDGYIQWRQRAKSDWPGRRINGRTVEAILPSTKHLNL